MKNTITKLKHPCFTSMQGGKLPCHGPEQAKEPQHIPKGGVRERFSKAHLICSFLFLGLVETQASGVVGSFHGGMSE